jgi:predicted exporter
MVQARADGSDLDAQQAAIDEARNSFASVAAAELTLRYSGAPRFAVESRAQIESEVRRLAIAGTVLMGGLLLIAFASLAALGTAMLPVATAVLAGITAVSLGFGTVHGVTLGFGTTLIGEAVDYAIYYLVQARSGDSSQPGWRHWLRTGWPTVRLGLLTSVCGFVALAFSGFPGLAQLGVFSIAGLLAAALTTRFVLPVLMPDGTHGVGLRRHLGRWAVRLVQRLPRARHAVTALGVLGVALLLWHRDHLWQVDLSSLSPVSAEALALDASLRADLGADDSGLLAVVQAADVQTLLQRVEGVTALLDTWVQDGRLSGYDAVTRWMPSLDTQRRRQAALPDAAALRTSLAQATRGGPLPAARLEPFVDAVQRSRSLELVTPESIRGSAVAPLVSNLLLRRADGGWTALLPLHAGATPPNEAALQQAVHGIEGAQALNIGAELRRLYRHYLGEAQGQALLGALGVVLLIALWLRSPRRLLAVCQPLLVAVLLTMATLAALGVALGILHLVGLLLVVAVGSNYALYFDLLRQQASFDADTLASLLLANATTVLSFGLIAGSEIPALSAIGRVVAPGALLALLLAATYAAPASPAPSREAPV